MSIHLLRFSCLGIALCATALLEPGADSKKGLRLSGPMALGFAGDVVESKISPDGMWVVFRGDPDTDNVVELFSAPIDASAAPAKLNATIVSGGILQGFRISPDSTRVVFWGDLGTNDLFEVFSAPIDASDDPVKLNGPLAPLGDVATSTFAPGVQISPDSSRVVFLADANTGVSEVWELFGAAIDGSAPVTRLNGSLIAEGDVGILGSSGQLFDPAFQISADGSRVLYLADQDVDGVRNLYSVPIAGGSSVQLNGAVAPGGYVGYQVLTPGYRISPDSSRVAFIASLDASGKNELYSAPIDGSLPAVKLNSPLPSPSSRVEFDFQISVDSGSVVYRADQTSFFLFELYSVPIDGSAASTELSDIASFPGVARDFQIGASHAAYRVGEELFSVPLDGSAAPLQISGPLPLASLVIPLRLTPDGSRVVYRGAQDSRKVELYSVPLDGSALPVQLNLPLVFGGDVTEFSLASPGSRVVYRANSPIPSVFELYSVAVDGSAPAVKLNAPLVPAGDVQSVSTSDFIPEFEISPDGTRVTYLADQEIPDVTELYSVPIDAGSAPVKLNDSLGASSVAGDVRGFAIGREHLVYRADQDTDEVVELYGLALPRFPGDPLAPATRLSGPDHNVEFDFVISPDESRVVYRASRDDIVFSSLGRELFSAPVDGSAPAVQLSAPLGPSGTVGTFAGGFLISPDSSRVVFLQKRGQTTEIFSVPLDGSAPPTRLNRPFALFGVSPSGLQTSHPLERQVTRFQISPDGTRVVFVADQDEPGIFELYSVPIDGGQAPRKLHPPLASGGVSLVEISPDSARVLFLHESQLHAAAIDGSGAPIALTALPLFPGGCGSWLAITPDSSRAVFLADATGSFAEELYSVWLDGSQPPIKLNGALPSGSEGVEGCSSIGPSFRLAPDGSHVVYRADQETLGVLELYAAPVDGSSAAIKLNPTLPAGGDVNVFLVTPDGERVVYGADQDTDELHEIFAVPLDGSVPPVQVNGPLVSNGVASTFSLSSDGLRVVYLADQSTNDVFELYAAPVRGGQSVKLNAPLVAGGDVRLPGFSSLPIHGITGDGTRVVYVADQDADEVHEIYLTFLTPYPRRR